MGRNNWDMVNECPVDENGKPYTKAQLFLFGSKAAAFEKKNNKKHMRFGTNNEQQFSFSCLAFIYMLVEAERFREHKFCPNHRFGKLHYFLKLMEPSTSSIGTTLRSKMIKTLDQLQSNLPSTTLYSPAVIQFMKVIVFSFFVEMNFSTEKCLIHHSTCIIRHVKFDL